MTLEDRRAFHEAKCTELRSFLLKWTKNGDGAPRAKARLVARGCADADALAGDLETASPTASRLGRTWLLSLSASSNAWVVRDVSTAFLQGLPQERQLWLKLPSEALDLLGCGPWSSRCAANWTLLEDGS